MNIVVRHEGKHARFKLSGDIDESGAEVLKRRFQELNMHSLTEVIFDFKDVVHIGSAGIGKLLLFYKDLALRGGNIKIENASESITELFCLLKLDTIFTIVR